MDDISKGDGCGWPAIQLPLDLSRNVVHVIRGRRDVPVEQWTKLKELLPDDECVRADRFRFDEPRRRFVTCRATLRQLLGSCCGVTPMAVPLQYGNHGKPGLLFSDLDSTAPPIEFSVSHSADLGLIAITVGSPVGIDVEELNSAVKTLKLAERYFAPSEVKELGNLTAEKQLAGFYRGWTCKEAYIKATGRGLSLSLSSFCVVIDPDKPACLRHVDDLPTEPDRWTTRSLDAGSNYAAAVMTAQPNCQIECWDWPSN